MNKKIVFLTGTRADFGKLKSLIEIIDKEQIYDVHIFVTGMHMQVKYGYTVDEIEKYGFKNIYKYINHTTEKSMDQTLAKTIEGLSNYVREFQPDLIVIHGDRVEALAGAIVGALNNILVAHVEGGEVSGTIDELIRHAVSKMSHIHFVSNDTAKGRLIQMGEKENNIYIIGSPDIDVMYSNSLPSLEEVKKHYDIQFSNYAILLFHSVTTEIEHIEYYSQELVDAVIESNFPFVVIYPNNDMGSNAIMKEYKKLETGKNFRVFPSIRFESFLVLLKNAKFILGNSSAGIREAPYYGLPAINIGTRQQNRSLQEDIINCGHKKEEILNAIHIAQNIKIPKTDSFGTGNSNVLFLEALINERFWKTSKQKQFNDLITTYA